MATVRDALTKSSVSSASLAPSPGDAHTHERDRREKDGGHSFLLSHSVVHITAGPDTGLAATPLPPERCRPTEDCERSPSLHPPHTKHPLSTRCQTHPALHSGVMTAHAGVPISGQGFRSSFSFLPKQPWEVGIWTSPFYR